MMQQKYHSLMVFMLTNRFLNTLLLLPGNLTSPFIFKHDDDSYDDDDGYCYIYLYIIYL